MLNQEEEAKIRDLKDKCRDLQVPPPPDIFIRLQVYDKNGVLTFDDIQRGHSWTRNYYNFMFGTLSGARGSNTTSFGAGHMSGKSTSGTISGSYTSLANGYGYSMYNYYNNSTSNNYGIVVGTSDTAYDKEQFAMGAIIASGNGAGQLAYQGMPAFAVDNIPTYTASPKAWQQVHTRVFNNNSGGLITVKETGLAWYAYLYSAASYFLLERSVLAPAVDVANGAQLTVTYTISMDFSAID